MIQLKVVSGSKAGTVWVARRFPVHVGRSADADLRLEESGVWDKHLKLEFQPAHGVVLTAQPEALTSVNAQTVQQVVLRNGDEIGLGSIKLQFWLSETRQAGLRFREGLTWAGIAVVSLGQVALIYWLLH